MSHFYPDEIIEEVRTGNDVVDVISEYVTLKKSGKNYFGCCPFHNEKTPSFSVSQEKQIFHCFGCGEGGNVVTFLMKVENIGFVDAIQILAKRARIELPEQDISDDLKKKNKLKETLLNINIETGRFYYKNLVGSNGEKAKKYLINRGINSDTVKKFGLGYSSDEWDSLYKYLKSKGFSDDLMLKVGLIKKSKASNYIDIFRDRLIFPIFDVQGKIIGFGGRTIANAQPKYLNSPETTLFNKSKNLYGLNIAKNSENKQVIIVEGYMDAISLHQFGLSNVVASLGTALTENQAKLISKYFDEVVIAYDSDTAGQTATLRGIEVLNNTGIRIKILQLPEGKDPDEYVRKFGAEKFKYLINNAKTFVQYKMDILRAKNNLNTVDGKINFLNNMTNILVKIENTMERDTYINILSNETGVSSESINAQINRKIYGKESKKKSIINSNIKNNIQVVDKKIDHAEKTLLLLISQEYTYKRAKDKISEDLFKDDINKKIAEEIIKRYNLGQIIEPGELMNTLNQPEEIKAISQVFSQNVEFDDVDRAVNELVNYICEINKKEKIYQLIRDNTELIEDNIEIQQKLNQLLRNIDSKESQEGR